MRFTTKSLLVLSLFLLPLIFFEKVEAQEAVRSSRSPTTNRTFSLPTRQRDTPVYEGRDLEGNSPICEQRRQYFPEIGQCDLRSEPTSAIRNVQVELIQREGSRFASDLKTDYFSKIESALVSQYAAVAWLAKENPLSSKDGRFISKAIEEASQKCTGKDRYQIENIKSKIKAVNPLTDLKLDNIPKEHLDRSREFIQKRMMIAWIESNRIERFLTDRPISKEEKEKLKKRRQMIRQTYPLVSTSYDGYLLRQIAKVHYGQVFDADSTQSHPQIDKILFPDSEGKYSVVEPGKQTRLGNEGMLNQILSKPIHPQVEAEINSLMASSLKNSFESVGAFCSLNPCQTMQLDLETTAQKISQKEEGGDVALAAACSCKLMSPTEYVGTGKQLVMAGATLGGLVLCPFTFGIGCYVSAAGAAGLAVSSVANTYGAIKDRNELAPLVKTVLALPGLSDEERQKILKEENENTGRIMGGVAGTLVGGVPSVAIVKQGTKILTSAEAFRPYAKTVAKGDVLLKAAKDQTETLKKMGLEFERQPGGMTLVESDVRYFSHNVDYSKGNLGENYYGEVFKVTKLPPKSKKASLSTNAFEHPEMADYLKKLDEMGIDLVVDTTLSLRGSRFSAYYSPGNSIALNPSSSWQTFLHEFQHAQFYEFIAPRFSSLERAVQVEGRSLKSVLSQRAIQEYGEREISRLQKLLSEGHTQLATNESMSVGRELDALGWRRYLPTASGTRTYATNYRVNSLAELEKSGISLTAAQAKALNEGRAEVVVAKAYEIGSAIAAPLVIYKGTSGAIEVVRNINMIYNKNSGEVVVQTPEGRTIFTKLEKR